MAEFFLVVIGLWIAYDVITDKIADRRERQRQNEVISLRRRILTLAPDSPAAYEKLGDALRESGHPAEAVASYEQAVQLAAHLSPAEQGAGHLAGSGLENKLRLARFELSHDAAAHGETIQTRQQVCRRCGNLSAYNVSNCETCNEPLPVDSFWDSLRRADIRRPILRETAESLSIFVVVFIALAFASTLPLEVKGVLMISATGVCLWKILRAIGGN